MTGQDVRLDRFLSGLIRNLETVLDFLDLGEEHKAENYLCGTLDAVRDFRKERLKQRRQTENELTDLDIKRWRKK